MKLKLVKLETKYRSQLNNMLDEWYSYDEEIIPYAISKVDYHNFNRYIDSLELKDAKNGLVPDSTFFCLDEERDIFVGAVNIRHYLSESLLLNGGHIGDGVRPSERRKHFRHRYVTRQNAGYPSAENRDTQSDAAQDNHGNRPHPPALKFASPD